MKSDYKQKILAIYIFTALSFAVSLVAVISALQIREEMQNYSQEEMNQLLLHRNVYPKPGYGPEEVIKIQLKAMATNDFPYLNAGLEIVQRFSQHSICRTSSEQGKALHPTYKSMLNHKIAYLGELKIHGNSATQAVILANSTGELAEYFFVLSKQEEGPNQNCWMTYTVSRIGKKFDA